MIARKMIFLTEYSEKELIYLGEDIYVECTKNQKK